MAKCLVGANGGGKVTVEGLSADTVLSGTIVTVKQGAKTVQQVAGTSPKILSVGGYIKDNIVRMGASSNIDISGFIEAGTFKTITARSVAFKAPFSGRKLGVTGSSADLNVTPTEFSAGSTVTISCGSGIGGGAFTCVVFD